MKDEAKTKEQLLKELKEVRRRLAELEKAGIERNRVLARLSKEVKLQTFLLDLHEKAPGLENNELYEFVLEQVVILTESAIGFLHLVSDDQKYVIQTTWNREALENCTALYETHYPLVRSGNWADCVRLKQPVVYNDYPDSPNQKGLPAGHTPVRRFMSIPVMEGDKVRIIFGVGNKSEEYDENDVFLVHVVANDLQKITGQRQAENGLRERGKELDCLYSIAEFIENTDSADELFQKAVNKMPQGWYFPEHACARITLQGQEFKTANFRETAWKISADIIVHGAVLGKVEVHYLAQMPERDEGPFLREERSLINAIAERLQRVIERQSAENERERLIADLQLALSEVRTLSGLLPLCSHCRNMRNDEGYWKQVEKYIANRPEAELSQGICSDCKKKLHPEFCEEE